MPGADRFTHILSADLIDQVVSSCAQLVRDEAAQKRGVTGVVIKGGLKLVERIRPKILEDLFYGLLPTFVERLTPLYEAHLAKLGVDDLAPSAFLKACADEVTATLLSVTDDRAQRSKLTALVGAYRKLRPLAEDNIRAAIPALGTLLDRYTERR